ncbi:MAG: protease [Novosphingobium sp. 17-62-19]|uniref:type 1 glutamine amidotransferase domain-containing protein n=1 Tax=Novosphingobium sp. 17-62-19 TaxID=1970406 RepID=UPI000BD1E423|nr:type 1 glutamine amidotransferase domain-containing protein [Novosphingobium sp. 17-62-19]OYX92941.1 MAG: protease [Novosphingobium sp. 35-62-5]OZA18695.1 MAG: protease [Novosphingobium sp. 17-62-19]HQS96108.1 type 1 glutamine amidotransferase domain-containing protein [Novosphingobium sp.]
MTKRVLIVATDGFEQSELEGPKKALEDAGIETVVASLKSGSITGWKDKNWGDAVAVNLTIEEVEVTDYDALLLPGGQMNPDILRMEDSVIDLINDFDDLDKPIAAICHAPWLLVEADIVDGRTVTSWPSIRVDLANAGADVVDEEVVVDGNLITSRNPDDIPAFSKALIAALAD